jgi:hypothetical protein
MASLKDIVAFCSLYKEMLSDMRTSKQQKDFFDNLRFLPVDWRQLQERSKEIPSLRDLPSLDIDRDYLQYDERLDSSFVAVPREESLGARPYAQSLLASIPWGDPWRETVNEKLS